MWIIPKNISPYVQDMGELISDLTELSQTLEQSAMWRSKPSQSSTWLKRLKKGGWILHLCTRILRPSHSKSFTEKWTSSLEDSHVSPFPVQEQKRELKTLDISSHTSKRASEIWGDLPLFSSKMSQESSLQKSENKVFSNMSSADWKTWITEQRQEYSARAKLEQATSENEYLLWVSDKEQTSILKMADIPVHIQQDEEKSNTTSSHRAYLNPRWVECLMGVPIGWTSPKATQIIHTMRTNSECSETESYPKQQNEPSASSTPVWSTPIVKTPSENPNKLYNKDGTPWDRKGKAYRPSGSKAQSNLRLEVQLESGEWGRQTPIIVMLFKKEKNKLK